MDLLAGINPITFFPAVPTMINAIGKHPRATEIDLPQKKQTCSKAVAVPFVRDRDIICDNSLTSLPPYVTIKM